MDSAIEKVDIEITLKEYLMLQKCYKTECKHLNIKNMTKKQAKKWANKMTKLITFTRKNEDRLIGAIDSVENVIDSVENVINDVAFAIKYDNFIVNSMNDLEMMQRDKMNELIGAIIQKQ